LPEFDDSSDSSVAWLRALDELEAALGAAASGNGATEWTPPGDLGPIPAGLQDRARQLLAGQREMIAELERSRRATATQLAAVRKIPGRPTGASVYLDTSG
jgi:hypothetical protein